MKHLLVIQNIASLIFEYKKYILSLAIAFIMALILMTSLNYFRDKKRATLSAEIAIGLANLKEGKEEKALYFLQNAFNKSEGLYRLIAGSGILNIVQHSPEKTLALLNILRSESDQKLLSPLFDSVYFSNLMLSTDKNFISGKDFQKFELSALKSDNNILKEQLANIFLTIGEKEKFKSVIQSIKIESSPSSFTAGKRALLLKSL